MSPLARAQAAIGVKYRPQGRCIAHGLDCVGLVALAHRLEVPRGYALRGGRVADIAAVVRAGGMVPVGDARAGDMILMRVAPGQLHLGIASEAGMIHADAGLRRVVERPGAPPWPVIGRWRREGD